MATTQSESRQTLRPIPVVRIEEEAEVPESLKRDAGSLRPVAGPATVPEPRYIEASGVRGAGGLSRQSLLRWTVGSGILGVIALLGGVVALWQPEPHAASPVLPDAVQAAPGVTQLVDPTANPERAALAAPAPEVAPSRPQALRSPNSTAPARKAATSPAKRNPTLSKTAAAKAPQAKPAKATSTKVEGRPAGAP